jgi:hypothetical protein
VPGLSPETVANENGVPPASGDAVPEQSTALPDRGPSPVQKQACRKCATKDLKRQPRSRFDRLLSLQSYECIRCNKRQRKLQFRGAAVVAFWAVLALTVAGVLFRQSDWFVSRGWFPAKNNAAQNDVDALSRARNAMGGQLSTYEQMMTKRPPTTLNNAAIIKLWKADAGTDVIVRLIRASNPDFDLTADGVVALRSAGVDRTIVLAMIEAAYTSR